MAVAWLLPPTYVFEGMRELLIGHKFRGDLMLEALERVDFETVTFLGHQLSGSGGMFGFQDITDIGAAVEQAARSADSDASRNRVTELFSCLDRIATISG